MSEGVTPAPNEAAPSDPAAAAESATGTAAQADSTPEAAPGAAAEIAGPASDAAAAADETAGAASDAAAAADEPADPGGKAPAGSRAEPAPGAPPDRQRSPEAGAATGEDQPTAAPPEAAAPAAKPLQPPAAKGPQPPKANRPAKSRSRKKSSTADKTTPRPAGVHPGAEVAGYRLEEQIGQGGMAVVYRARDERLDRRVALKLLAPGLAADAAFRQRFIRESRAAAAVDHPNIIPVYDAGDAGGALFIAMRYVQGGDVRSLLSEHGPLSAARVFSIISQVAAALDAAHARGLIHRDIKPANMLLDASDSPTAGDDGRSGGERHEHVYLSDFGISKLSVSSQQLTSTGQFVGTLDYIAPEQVDGRSLDGRADLYSLGCATFELLSGRPPYRKEQQLAIIAAHLSEPPPSVVAVRPELSAAVDMVLAKAMAKTPDERYATCAQFSADLGRALGLLSGEVEAARGAAPASPAAGGGQPQQWAPTELAGPQTGQPGRSGPGSEPGWTGTPAPGGQGGQLAGASGQGPGQPYYNLGAATVGGGQQQPPGGTAPLGTAGSAAPYGQQYGQQQYGPGAPGSGPYGPGPYGPGPYGQQPASPPRRSRAVIAAVAAAVIAVLATAGILVDKNLISGGGGAPSRSSSQSQSQSPTTPASSTPASPARAQANAINNLLSSSTASRSQLQAAVNDVQQCIQLGFAVSQIQQIRDQRQTEYQQTQGLSASALPNGTVLLSDLKQALRYSLRADNAYLTWAQQENASCQVGSSANASSDDAQAISYKQAFVGLWNPVASQYGLPPASPGTI